MAAATLPDAARPSPSPLLREPTPHGIEVACRGSGRDDIPHPLARERGRGVLGQVYGISPDEPFKPVVEIGIFYDPSRGNVVACLCDHLALGRQALGAGCGRFSGRPDLVRDSQCRHGCLPAWTIVPMTSEGHRCINKASSRARLARAPGPCSDSGGQSTDRRSWSLPRELRTRIVTDARAASGARSRAAPCGSGRRRSGSGTGRRPSPPACRTAPPSPAPGASRRRARWRSPGARRRG